MRRSEINRNIERTIDMLNSISFRLPGFSYWKYDEWKRADIGNMKETMLGWDITDLGTGDFDQVGAVLFTIRNGLPDGKAGEIVRITTGNSITLTPFMFHTFGAEGDLIVGEVSSINDDKTDNYFSEKTARFADIVEDEPALAPLCNEYDRL